jgi:hypothetical protein
MFDDRHLDGVKIGSAALAITDSPLTKQITITLNIQDNFNLTSIFVVHFHRASCIASQPCFDHQNLF